MSCVYVAREEALGRDVVVKVLAPELAERLSAERFAREIRSSGLISLAGSSSSYSRRTRKGCSVVP